MRAQQNLPTIFGILFLYINRSSVLNEWFAYTIVTTFAVADNAAIGVTNINKEQNVYTVPFDLVSNSRRAKRKADSGAVQTELEQRSKRHEKEEDGKGKSEDDDDEDDKDSSDEDEDDENDQKNKVTGWFEDFNITSPAENHLLRTVDLQLPQNVTEQTFACDLYIPARRISLTTPSIGLIQQVKLGRCASATSDSNNRRLSAHVSIETSTGEKNSTSSPDYVHGHCVELWPVKQQLLVTARNISETSLLASVNDNTSLLCAHSPKHRVEWYQTYSHNELPGAIARLRNNDRNRSIIWRFVMRLSQFEMEALQHSSNDPIRTRIRARHRDNDDEDEHENKKAKKDDDDSDDSDDDEKEDEHNDKLDIVIGSPAFSTELPHRSYWWTLASLTGGACAIILALILTFLGVGALVRAFSRKQKRLPRSSRNGQHNNDIRDEPRRSLPVILPTVEDEEDTALRQREAEYGDLEMDNIGFVPSTSRFANSRHMASSTLLLNHVNEDEGEQMLQTFDAAPYGGRSLTRTPISITEVGGGGVNGGGVDRYGRRYTATWQLSSDLNEEDISPDNIKTDQ